MNRLLDIPERSEISTISIYRSGSLLTGCFVVRIYKYKKNLILSKSVSFIFLIGICVLQVDLASP
jgi:hypothetical protein